MEVSKQTIVEAIQNGATTLKEVKEHTTACTGNTCKKKNPNKRCCSQEINQLIKQYSKGNIMNKNVLQTNNGVKISFTGAVEKQNIINMVQNCQNGQCECMSEETKQKITNMEVKGIDGDVALELSGNVSKEEIEAALAKSKVLNS
ncbi:MAG: (2Fe-2S)-binding protein [Sulfurovum sp.]|nr:(2Fe-2S)-binding protein [Sulfurovum sp.]MCB4744065.1 (2Fe-2S)-binding protein [Sulfurovum sp.]MCB4746611.1 (2Fe-2S)-binding protein [Sulfurovum sp.]MCB4749802.1 (2Fe-2S)-binding protein [Sulfurovum sp.]MCB4750571.1 (2Fe-2S)-binding protein [Sulfurovum sp.]